MESEPNDEQNNQAQNSKGKAGTVAAKASSSKIISSAALVAAILLSLLGGLAYVVRSLKNVKLTLHLKLKRDDKAQKKY